MKSKSTALPKRAAFSRGKDAILTRYKRTLGAFQEKLEVFEDEYDVPFSHTDEMIPDAHKLYYQIVGMRQVIQDFQQIDAIHAEISEDNDYGEWDC